MGAAVNALRAGADTQIVALADVFQEKIDWVLGQLRSTGNQDRLDVPRARQFVGFDACESLLDSSVDAVIFATPGGFRPFHFEAAVRNKKAVFLEKPVAIDPNGLTLLSAANLTCKQNRTPVVVGMQDRYRKSAQAVLAEIERGALGKLESAEAMWNFPNEWLWQKSRAAAEKQTGRNLTEMEYQIRCWHGFSWLSGDWVMEALIHNVDLCVRAMGAKPLRATGFCEQRERKGTEFANVSDFLRMEVEFAGGAKMKGEMALLKSTPGYSSCKLTGEKGSASFLKPYEIHDKDGKVVWSFSERDNDPYQEEINTWLSAVRDGTSLNTLDSVIESHTVAIMGRTAAYRGTTVEYSDTLKSREKLWPGNPRSLSDKPPVLPDRFGDYEFPAKPLAG